MYPRSPHQGLIFARPIFWFLGVIYSAVSFRLIYFGDSPSDQGETCTTLVLCMHISAPHGLVVHSHTPFLMVLFYGAWGDR